VTGGGENGCLEPARRCRPDGHAIVGVLDRGRDQSADQPGQQDRIIEVQADVGDAHLHGGVAG
jgi:hypothetical protein